MDIQSDLTLKRASLSPSMFSEGAFNRFRRSDWGAKPENDNGKGHPYHLRHQWYPNQQNVLFTELTPITDDTVEKPQPVFFDGACLDDLSREVQNDERVRLTAIPTKHASDPVAPNFHMEIRPGALNASASSEEASLL